MQDTLPKEYDHKAVEQKWRSKTDGSVYQFDWESDKPQYIIDTPPPYPTGNLHIGNSLNWCYIDFVARYKRMRGYNVMFPQGWDCHGLPTEVKVEETHGITRHQIPRSEFRDLCKELTLNNIRKMKDTMKGLGFSIDWNCEYVTMDPAYYSMTQKSFVRMYADERIYQREGPVNWCPRCGTAIAFAEVEYEDRETHLNYLYFGAGDCGDDGNGSQNLEIATTRPELLPACVAVAVHPDDKRFTRFVGGTISVPLFNYDVPVIADEEVDPAFGTGVVMICTFGDKQDVRWWIEHNLPLRMAIDRDGIMTSVAEKYKGMNLADCRKAILSDLESAGMLYKQEPLEQSVGACWRCGTPIEILSEKQWYVKVDQDEILSTADEIDWVPSHMLIRLENWTKSMEWDWCISRQRLFATPIPVWYCKGCGKIVVAKEEWLPLDPTESNPPEPCECGSDDFEAEADVLDTWMDSSLSAMAVSGWVFGHELKVPAQLRPQGHDIIRTWAFYTILRTHALTGKRPWDAILINGMVFGEDGHKMSKSLDNIIAPEEVTDQYGADAFRQWAAIGGSTGSDIMFRWKDVVAASRFQQKMWSIIRFSLPHTEGVGDIGDIDKDSLTTIDQWIISKLNSLILDATDAMENYQFDITLKMIRSFAWDVLADHYIELVKHRLYGEPSPNQQAARQTLGLIIDSLARLLAPITPFFSEEVYSYLNKTGSVHAALWPTADESMIDSGIEHAGGRIRDIAWAIRRYKSEHGMALNAPLDDIKIYADAIFDCSDIAGAANTSVQVIAGTPDFEHRAVGTKPNMKVLGPIFRKDAGKIVKALSDMDPDVVAQEVQSGVIRIAVGSETFEVPADSVAIEREVVLGGRAVDVIEVNGAVVVITR
uniref:Valine--tRNA ligase n=1 Tax=Candidatus Methanogaster sp. ANME-2c ERB4 TaxID=2759911 RepID=A0A7G9YIH7_9EURY|nr:isoleucine--tRNA ligase [Methanosarcinales archaeon ANME-2c ERB4]QNO47811.1 isoleucine--tRNA ligase [Methanosarcinales archaeon ANME-2c ERB4]